MIISPIDKKPGALRHLLSIYDLKLATLPGSRMMVMMMVVVMAMTWCSGVSRMSVTPMGRTFICALPIDIR